MKKRPITELMNGVRGYINLYHYNDVFIIAKRYHFEGGGSYGMEVRALVHDSDANLLQCVIAHMRSELKDVVGDYDEIPKPSLTIYQSAGLRSMRALDKAAATISILIYQYHTDFFFRPSGQDKEEPYKRDKIDDTTSEAIVKWLIENKSKYAGSDIE